MSMGIIPKSRIFGSDVAGVVEAVGSNVRAFKPGDAVFGDLTFAGFGGLAEYVAAPENLLALIPAGVPFNQAAALPTAAVTALQGLRNQGEIAAGKRVLIYGAGGGVGIYAVQLAKHFGAHITALCGPRNVALMRTLGVEKVLDYSKENVMKSADRFDLILAVNGRQRLTAYKALLAPNGICVVVGGSLSQVLPATGFGWLFSLGGKKVRALAARQSPQDLAFVIGLVAQGKLKPVIEKVYPFEQAADAMLYINEKHSAGKVLVSIHPA
jgi:NADPH:quinone reductase-like Zn-dependent oxidoreductase